jgi:hypothetical protein
MPTAKQIAASRANGQKSRGPTTPPLPSNGKANSKFNALKHGIHAQQQIMFTESADDPAELAAEYHELHRPANADERFLVDTLVNNEWRLRRLRCVEAELWRAATKLFLETHTVEAAASGNAFIGSGPAFERLQRIVNSCERAYHRALKELVALADARLTPQAEEAKATSDSPGSFRQNPQTPVPTAPEPPETLIDLYQCHPKSA